MLNWLSNLPPALIYVVVGLLVFVEDALFVGFVVPGETAAVIGGVLANRGTVNIWALAAVVVCAAIAGDSVGFEVGRHFGERLLGTRPLRRHQVRLDKARALIRRRGAEAVFLGRFVSFFRALMPPLAAMSHLPYRRFLFFNALGGLVWGVGFTLLGYFAGAAYSRVEHLVGGILAGVVATIVIIGLVMWTVRRHRAERAEEDEGDEEGGEDESEGGVSR
ncbi:membrane-associated protein [Catenulispora sp. GP43]|uniref:DedA family protein n=1 Tax=Catenulispora sp. GP43 TaxID=3156263 RepID=UPI00351475B1